MEGVKKRLAERGKRNGLYVHYSPPKAVPAMTSGQIRQWARGGDVERLEQLVLEGQGHRLLGETSYEPKTSNFLRAVPLMMAKCEALHDAVVKGSLGRLQELLEAEPYRKKYVMCKDSAGVGLLHKAVFLDFQDIAAWLVHAYPSTVHQRDSEGRTPLHYAAACREPRAAAALLEAAGAVLGARDAAGRTAAHYRAPALRARLALPEPPPPPARHSLGDMPRDNTRRAKPGLVVKPSSIRIWCHDCDLGRLQRVLWEGLGTRLLTEVSNQPVVKKFLEAVPFILNTIRDSHSAVINNDADALKNLTGDPVPPILLSSKDPNNMTVLHKAAGLGRLEMVKYIGERWPQGLNDVDDFGKTPLHYAAAVVGNRDCYDALIGLGAEEGILDDKKKTAGYYLNRGSEMDKSAMTTLPEAPRTASNTYPASWDWKLLSKENISELGKKSRRRNKTSNESVSTGNTTDTLNSLSNQFGGINTSSTMESMKNLPDLNDASEAHTIEEKAKPPSPLRQQAKEESPFIPLTELNGTHGKEDVEEITEVGEPEEEVGGDEEDKEEENVVREEDTQNYEKTSDAEKENEEEDNPEKDAANEEEVELEEEEKQVDDVEKNEEQTEEAEKEDPSNGADDNDIAENENEEDNVANEPEDVNENNLNDETNIVDEEKDVPDVNDKSDAVVKNDETERNMVPTEEMNKEKEDDDDVQVPGESESEYGESNLRSTAEASDTTNAKRGSASDGPNTQESLIEGIVNAEAEMDSQDASVERAEDSIQGDLLFVENDEIDPEVSQLINSANMEMLAALVLNGEGARLVGRRSRNQELQAFLDNVSTYMKKINRVHLAAREGNIRDLQAALDRRKFAIARDPISPNGATPLHVATLFGKTNIIKYLGGRFPETLSAVDFEGRTALHYAAVIPDNGHYYNLLQQLGANSKDLDDNGKSAEEYHKKGDLTLSHLLEDFGVDESMKNEMLADRGVPNDATNGHMDIPIFKTEEGRYLAKSLGDPLIKGLTEVANVKPKDPIAYLAGFLHSFPEHEKRRIGTQESNILLAHEEADLESEQPPPLQNGVEEELRRDQPIDVVTIDPHMEPSPDAPEAAFSSANRDEHGQSMLHFAAARTHARNALFQLLQESDVSLGYRDELYRTARDVSIQANIPENTTEIDRFILHLAARGNTEKIMELLLEGYEHILDVVDEEGVPISEVVAQRGLEEVSKLLDSIKPFEDAREALHAAIRSGNAEAVRMAVEAEGGRMLARGKNAFGRTALHVAVLAQNEEIVAHLAQAYSELLRLGDNLERTPLHYAMGVEKMEALSRTLTRSGAKRVLKDLKGRQPSYYFMNKSDILRLREEEEVY